MKYLFHAVENSALMLLVTGGISLVIFFLVKRLLTSIGRTYFVQYKGKTVRFELAENEKVDQAIEREIKKLKSQASRSAI